MSAHLLLGRLLGTHPVVHTLRLRGVISEGPQGLSLHSIEKLLARAFDKATAIRLDAVAIMVNSPGGSPVQASLIYDRIKTLSAENDVPVYTFAEDLAVSGGYWLLTSGDKVYAHKASLVGSIGVTASSFGFSEALERLGVERRVQTAGPLKARGDPFLPVKKEDQVKIQEIADKLHDVFKAHVCSARLGCLDEARLDEVFSGDVWLGGDATALGLVDGTGDLRSVMRLEFGESVYLRPIEYGMAFLRPFRSGLGPRTAACSILTELAQARDLGRLGFYW